MGCAASKPKKQLTQRADDKSVTLDFNPQNNPIVRRRFLSQQRDAAASLVLSREKIPEQSE